KPYLEDASDMGHLQSARRSGAPCILVAIGIALSAVPAAARISGIVGYSGKSGGLYCSNAGFGCHTAEAVTRAPLGRCEGPTQVDPDAQVTYQFIVTSQVPSVQVQAGFNVAASAGDLMTVAGQSEQLLSSVLTQSQKELTHTKPKDNDANAEASWQFM